MSDSSVPTITPFTIAGSDDDIYDDSETTQFVPIVPADQSFGAPSLPPFGAPSLPPFGAPSLPPFGAPSLPPFGDFRHNLSFSSTIYLGNHEIGEYDHTYNTFLGFTDHVYIDLKKLPGKFTLTPLDLGMAGHHGISVVGSDLNGNYDFKLKHRSTDTRATAYFTIDSNQWCYRMSSTVPEVRNCSIQINGHELGMADCHIEYREF